MEKNIRKAVRCFVIKDNDVLVVKYKRNNLKGYYDIPGGKIEEPESIEQTAIREIKEETGLEVRDLKYRGNMRIEYPNRIYECAILLTSESKGEPQEFDENESLWININELLQQEKLLPDIMILDRFFIKGLLDNDINFDMYIKVDDNENILEIKYLYNRDEEN